MNSLGFGILLFAAIDIGMMGTLTEVMSQQPYTEDSDISYLSSWIGAGSETDKVRGVKPWS